MGPARRRPRHDRSRSSLGTLRQGEFAPMSTSLVSDITRTATVPFTAARILGTGWLGYAATAARRGGSPMAVVRDVRTWIEVDRSRETPQYVHPHTVVREWPVARLLDFSDDQRGNVVPTLILPPQAGHASTAVDFGADQSQVITLRDAGL